MTNDDVLCYDIETITEGRADPTKDRLRFFCCYSYKTNKYYCTKEIETIQKIISKHKFLVGFNTEYYDNPVLERSGIDFKYKIIIDLRKIIKQRAGGMKTHKGMLGNVLLEYSLDYITKFLDLVNVDEGKLKIDKTLFSVEKLTFEQEQEMKIYGKRDVEVTKKLYEWLEEYFAPFKEFLKQEDIDRKSYLTTSIAKFAYKAICKEMGWGEVYGEHTDPEEETISGGYVAYPAGERFEGNLYCFDYNCLPAGTQIKMWRKCLSWYNKPIEKLKVGDAVVNQQGKQIIDNIKVQDYDGELITITLENNKTISCTPNHIFPVFRDGKKIDVRADNILSTDELFTVHSKRGYMNGHFISGKIKKECVICKKIFKVFPSERKNSCSKTCANKLKSLNSPKTNLGKNKDNCEWFKQMSKKLKGKKRSVTICKNIAEGNRRATQQGKSKYFYNGVFFKSIYELKFAQGLDRDGIKWEYVPKVFKLPHKIIYTPDFYLPEFDKWVEVKGVIVLDTKSTSYHKFKEFIKQYPNSILIDESNVNKMKELLYGKN